MVCVVIGVTHHNTLGMVRCIGEAGISIKYLILTDGKKNSYISYSKYVKKTLVCDNNEKSILITLASCKDNKSKAVIITCTDFTASVLDKNYDLINKDFYFFNAGKSGLLTKYMNKQVQTEEAYWSGLKVPTSKEFYGNFENAIYPCILKYSQSINGGKKIMVCRNHEELFKAYSNFDNSNPILLQQLVNKKQEIVIVGVSANNKIIIPGYILKHREYDGGTNFSSVFPIDKQMTHLVNGCKTLVNKMSYEGLFGIEFIFDGKDYYFIEINLRNDATTYSIAKAGCNLPYIYIMYKLGMDNKIASRKVLRPITSIVEFNDFKHRKENGITLIKWVKEYISSECKYYFNWKDLLPFIFAPFK